MKKLGLFLGLLLAAPTYSQSDYYIGKTTVEGTNVVYRCFPELPGRIIIANAQAYSRVNGPAAVYKDGTPMSPDAYRRVSSNDPDDSILISIIKSTLSFNQLNELKRCNEALRIIFVIELDGSIAEVGFIMSEKSPLLRIPVDQYYEMEKQIKSRIQYILDDKTKCYYLWLQDPIYLDFKDVK